MQSFQYFRPRWIAKLFAAAIVIGGFPLSLVAHQGVQITANLIRPLYKVAYLLALHGVHQ